MKKIWILVLAGTALLGRPLWAQADAAALETAIHGKPMGLRNYPADPVVRYTWLGGKLLPGPVELHGLEAFFPDTVRLKSGKVLIEGQTSALVKNAGRLAPMVKTPMRLEIDLQGTDAATVFPQLAAALFFPSLKATLESLPDSVSDLLPFPNDVKFQSACGCTHILEDGKWVKIADNDSKLTSPTVIKATTNPGLDQKAVDEKLSGTITLIYFISDMGRVDDVWVAKPLGPDVDEIAGKAGRENTFKPGTYDGKPVGTVVMQTISVN
jgi:hypothetical protein